MNEGILEYLGIVLYVDQLSVIYYIGIFNNNRNIDISPFWGTDEFSLGRWFNLVH